MDIQVLLKSWDKCKAERSTTDTQWQEIADYMFPKRDFITERTPGENRARRIFDSTGSLSGETLASSLNSNLLPVQTKWFYLNVEDGNRDYWETVEKKMLGIFSSASSRFALNAHELFLDLVFFGTAVMGVFNRKGVINFKTIPLKDCWIEEGPDGVVNTLKYLQKYKPEEVVEFFGAENVHENVIKAAEKKQDTKIDVLYCVGPRYGETIRGGVVTSKPFYSQYVDVTNKHLLGKEGGYDEFPFLVPRFSKRSGENYGYGPGAQALSEVKMLNEITESMLRASAKGVDPNILSPVDGVILPMRIDPGGISFYNPDVGEPRFMNNNYRPDYFDFIIKEKKALIEKMFFIDWLTLPQQDRMTATETMQRAQDSFKNMSAINSRIESEFLSALISRVFVVGVDIGLWDIPPKTDQGKEIKVEYISPMAIAQKSISANGLMQALNLVGNLAQFDQSVAGLLNTENIARDQMMNTFFLPTTYVRDEEEMEEMRLAQAEAQEAQMQAQSMQQYGSAAKDIASATEALGGM